MTAMMTAKPSPELVKQSVLAILGDSDRPLSTAELEGFHGQFLTGRLYRVLQALQASGQIVRQRCLRLPPGRTTFWWLPNRSLGRCSIAGCHQAATEFVAPRFEVKESHITDQATGLQRLLWREPVEVTGTGGGVCASEQHQKILLDRSLAAPGGRGTSGK